MAKRTMVNRTMRQARSVMKNYVRPGAATASKTAEETLKEVLHVMGEARDMLSRVAAAARKPARKKRRGGAKRRKRPMTAVRNAVKRRKMPAMKRRKGRRKKR